MSEERRFTQGPGHRYEPRRARQRSFHDIHRPAKVSVAPEPVSHTPTPALPQAATQPPSVKAFDVAPTKKAVRTPSVAKPAAPRLHKSQVLKRQIVDRAISFQRQERQQRKRSVLAFGLGGVAASILITAGLIGFNMLRGGSEQPAGQATLGAQTQRSAAASEIPPTPDMIRDYIVEDQRPRLITIKHLGVRARVVTVERNYISEPTPAGNIYDVGWLKDTALPGSSGVAIMNGHTAGTSKAGVFARVAELSVGDAIDIELGNGTTVTYKVVRSKQFPSNALDMNAAGQAAIAGKPGLNIITNEGRFNVRTNQFEPRTVIFATLQ